MALFSTRKTETPFASRWPPPVRAVVGPLVEMLAAIPSVIVGFFGLVVLAPVLQRHVDPALHSVLGFLPISHYKNTDYSVFFGANTTQKPKKYDRPEATANAAISAVFLAAWRFWSCSS